MLLGAPVLVYLLNIAALPLEQLHSLGLARRDAGNLLAFLNLGFVGFVLTQDSGKVTKQPYVQVDSSGAGAARRVVASPEG